MGRLCEDDNLPGSRGLLLVVYLPEADFFERSGLLWIDFIAADFVDESQEAVAALDRVIPLKGELTKRDRVAAWILNRLCGYRATNQLKAAIERG